jgi:hypothetical protein
MDPYLERRWGDVHGGLCYGIRASLQSKLPKGLRARVQEDVLLEEGDDEELSYFEPDISIVENKDFDDSLANYVSSAVAVKPIAIRHVHYAKRRRWVEILDSSDGNRLVTAIEILSPGNKASGNLNKKYRAKLDQYLAAGANVVEIDLLRSSRKRLAVPDSEIPEDRRAAYYVSVSRAADPTLWLVTPMNLRDPLPVVLIPCREMDAAVPLDLQPIIDRVYMEGGHDDLDYSEPPDPPFDDSDAKWAAELVAAARPA